MGRLEEGARNAVRICMGIKPDEKVLIISDKYTSNVSEAIRNEVLGITGNVDLVLLENLGDRPLKEFPKELERSIRKSNAIFYAAQSVPGEIYPFRRKLLDTVQESGARHAHMPNISEEIMGMGLGADNRKIQEIADKVYDTVSNCREIRVEGNNGTDFTAEFSDKYSWVTLGSIIRDGEWSNLPGAEVMTYPKDINGLFVADGVLGDYFVMYGDLKKIPVYIDIKNGKAVSVECKKMEIENELNNYLDRDRNGSRVGEFALGTNIFLKRFIGVLLQDEKFPTVHIAFGNPYPKLTGAPYRAKTHIDAVTRDVDVWVDKYKIMQKGKYLI